MNNAKRTNLPNVQAKLQPGPVATAQSDVSESQEARTRNHPAVSFSDLVRHSVSFSTSFGRVHLSYTPSSESNTRLELHDKLPCGSEQLARRLNNRVKEVLTEFGSKANLSLLKLWKDLVDSYHQEVKELHEKHKNV